MEVSSAGDDPPAREMHDLAGEAAMALSALMGPPAAQTSTISFDSATSAISTLISIENGNHGPGSTATTADIEPTQSPHLIAAQREESSSPEVAEEHIDEGGSMEDDIAGLLNLTQAAAKMRPSKRAASLPPPRSVKLPPPPKMKPVKEVKPKAKPMPPPKAKLLKPTKPVKNVKVKGTVTRRHGEGGAKSSEKEKHGHRDGLHASGGSGANSMDVDADELQMDKDEFRHMLESAVRESEIQMGKEVRKYKAGSAEVYGEALPDFVDLIRETLQVKSSDVFYDIGSGIGNVVCQMAVQVGCKCYGVEIRSDLFNISERIYDYVRKESTKRGVRMGEVQLTNADALTQPTLLVDSTIVYLNNVCFPESMQQPLEHFFTETLQHGTRVVTIKELFPRMRPTTERFARSFATLFKFPCDKYEAPEGSVSWMHKGVPFYVYTVDREAWASVSLAINRPIGHSSDRNHLKSSLASSSSSVKNELASSSSTTPKNASKAKKASSLASPAPPIATPSSSYTNPHSYFCLQPVDIYPAAIHAFSETMRDDSQIGSPIVTVSSADSSFTVPISDSSVSEVMLALDSYKSLQTSRLLSPPSYVDFLAFDTHPLVTLNGEEKIREFSPQRAAELRDLFDSSESNSETSLASVDRQMRAELRAEREERANKLNEITRLNVEARRLDAEWQESWLKTEALRAQLAQLEDDLAVLTKSRHAAVNSLASLAEDETDESLKTIEEGAATKIQDFLESSKKFIEEHDIEVSQTKRGGRGKVDRRFGPRPKKAGAKQNIEKEEEAPEDSAAATTASSSSSAPQESNTMEEEEEDEVESEPGTRSSSRLSKMKNSNSMDIDEPEGRVRRSQVVKKAALLEELQERNELAAAALAGQGSDFARNVVSDFVRAPRPKRVVTMVTSPPVEPAKKSKQVKPGQKSLDRRQLRKSLMEALLASADGKLSIVELRQACKDLPPFKDLKEKQIERKVWDALSKAHDQFKHALPTPAERKAHAMGAGKAGLWSLHPRWKHVPTPSVSSQDSADVSDNDIEVDIEELNEDDLSDISDSEDENTIPNGPSSSLNTIDALASTASSSITPAAAALASLTASSSSGPSLSSLVSTATNDFLLESIGNRSRHSNGTGLINGSPTIKLRLSSVPRVVPVLPMPTLESPVEPVAPYALDLPPQDEPTEPVAAEPAVPEVQQNGMESDTIEAALEDQVEESVPEQVEEHQEATSEGTEINHRKRPRPEEEPMGEIPVTEPAGPATEQISSSSATRPLEGESPPEAKRPLTVETMNALESTVVHHLVLEEASAHQPQLGVSNSPTADS